MNGADRTLAELVSAEEHVSAFARAVALRRAVIMAVVGGALVLAVSQGWITPDLSSTVNADLASGFGFLSVVGAGAWIHRAVTPAKQALQPVNSAGQKLVPDPSAADALASYSGGDAAVGAAFDDAIASLATPFMEGGSIPATATIRGGADVTYSGDAQPSGAVAGSGAHAEPDVNPGLTTGSGSDPTALGGGTS